MLRKNHILVVEDDADLAEVLRHNLVREGYSVALSSDGHSALAQVRQRIPNLIVLDRMLPHLSGDQVVKSLRREPKHAAIPIIIVSAKSDEADELVGFSLGVDDYVTKPFSIKSLLARIAAVLRRRMMFEGSPETMVVEPFCLDLRRHELTIHNANVALTATELRILRSLMAGRGAVLSRGDLIDDAIGRGTAITDRTIDVHILSIRKKIRQVAPRTQEDRWIQTIRGVGYSFRRPSPEPPQAVEALSELVDGRE